MADIANFLAQNSPRYNRADQDRSHSNALMANNAAARIPQMNRMQDLEIQRYEQVTNQDRTANARKFLGDAFSGIAQSQDPINTGRSVLGNSSVQAALRDVGMDPAQFTIDNTDTPESVQKQSMDYARVFGAQNGDGMPAGVVEHQYLTQGLTPEDQVRARRVKLGLDSRAGQGRITNIGGVPTYSGIGDDGQPFQMPLSTLTGEAAAAGTIAGAQQGARERETTAAIPGQVTAKTRTERLALQVDEGFSASDSMPVINRAIELLGTVKTGGINAAALAASNLLGVTGADEAELSNNLGKAVLSQLRSTFGAAFTEREGARLDSIEANFGKSTEGNMRLLQQLQKIVEREALRGINAAVQMGDQATADQIREGLNFRLTPGGGTQPPSQPTRTGATGAWSVTEIK